MQKYNSFVLFSLFCQKRSRKSIGLMNCYRFLQILSKKLRRQLPGLVIADHFHPQSIVDLSKSEHNWGSTFIHQNKNYNIFFCFFFIYFMTSFMLVCVFYPYNKKILFITSQRFDASHFLFVTLHCATFLK